MSDLNNPNVNSSTPGAPPQHPQSVGAGGPGAGGAVGGTTNVNPTGPSVQNTTAGGGLQDKLKGAFGVVHGSGEALRGTTNSYLDQIGEAIAGRGSNDAGAPTRSEASGQTPNGVAGAGADEVKAGIRTFQRN